MLDPKYSCNLAIYVRFVGWMHGKEVQGEDKIDMLADLAEREYVVFILHFMAGYPLLRHNCQFVQHMIFFRLE